MSGKGRISPGDRAIAYRFGSGRATFVPMMQSTDLGKCDDLASRSRWIPQRPENLCLMTDAFDSYDNNENNRTKRDGGASH
jgi:hypothetical protein